MSLRSGFWCTNGGLVAMGWCRVVDPSGGRHDSAMAMGLGPTALTDTVDGSSGWIMLARDSKGNANAA